MEEAVLGMGWEVEEKEAEKEETKWETGQYGEVVG